MWRSSAQLSHLGSRNKGRPSFGVYALDCDAGAVVFSLKGVMCALRCGADGEVSVFDVSFVVMAFRNCRKSSIVIRCAPALISFSVGAGIVAFAILLSRVKSGICICTVADRLDAYCKHSSTSVRIAWKICCALPVGSVMLGIFLREDRVFCDGSWLVNHRLGHSRLRGSWLLRYNHGNVTRRVRAHSHTRSALLIEARVWCSVIR